MHVNKIHKVSYMKILIFMLILTFLIGTTIAFADGGADKQEAHPDDVIYMHAESLWDEFDIGPAPFDENQIPDNEKTYLPEYINGAILTYWPSDQAAGTGGFDTYLAISAKDKAAYSVEERGVNTDQVASNQKYIFDEDNAKTRALPLDAVPVVNIEGTLYREFAVDINQLTGGSHTSWEVFQIWQTYDQYSIGQYVAYPELAPAPAPSGSGYLHHTLWQDEGVNNNTWEATDSKAVLVWDLDGYFGDSPPVFGDPDYELYTTPSPDAPGGYLSTYGYNPLIPHDWEYKNNSVVMDYMVNEGSGKADYKLYVPHAWFDLDIPYVVFACDFGYTQFKTMSDKHAHGGIIDTTEIYGDGDSSPSGLISDYYPNHYEPGIGEDGYLQVGANDGFEEWGVLGYDLSTKSGYKFNDLNGDGNWDEGEPGLEGWKIYVDYNDDGQWQSGEHYDITDSTGFYEITDIWPSSMVPVSSPTEDQVWKVREVLESGWIQTYPTLGYYEEVFYPGSISTGNNFGNFFITPSLEIVKTGDELSKVGDDVTYTFTITNTGNVELELESLIDSVLGDLTGLTGYNSEADILSVGESVSFSIDYTIQSGDQDPLTNIVTAEYEVILVPGWYVSDNDDHTVNLFQPAVSIEKTGDELSKATDTVTYNIRIENTSSSDTPLLVFDSFSDSLVTSSGITLPAELINGLTTGEVVEFSYTYTILGTDPDPLDNTATIHFHPEGFTNDIWDEDGHTVELFQPSITIDKTGDDLSKVGDDIHYVITLENTSSSDSPNLTGSLVDPMLGLDISVDLAPSDIITFGAIYTVQPDDPDPLENTATVSVSPVGFPNVLEASDSHITNLFQPAVTIEKTGDELSKATDTVTYDIRIENTSSSDTPLLVFDSFSDSLVTSSGITLPAELTNGLTTGEVVEFSYTYTILGTDPDPLDNTATVHFHPEGFTNDIWDEDGHTVELFQPSITIDKTGDGLSKVGDDINYVITVENTSSADSPNLNGSLVDPILGLSESLDLAPGDIITFGAIYTVQPGDPDPLENTATVSVSPVGFPNVLEASDSHTTNLFQPAISVEKTGDELSKIGDTVDFVITVNNNSSVDTPNMEFNIVDPQLGINQNVTLPSGSSHVINFNGFTIPEDASDPYVNTVSVTASPIGFSNVLEESDSHSINLFQPAISVTKTGDELSKIGDLTDFTITVCNDSSFDTPAMYFDITDTDLGVNLTDQAIAAGGCLVINATMPIPDGADDPYVNTVDVHATIDGFPNELNDSASHSVNLFQPSIYVEKSGDELSKIGDTVDYVITVNNTSSADTPDMEFNIVDPELNINENVTLASGATYVIEFNDYTIPADAPDPYVNTVTVTASPLGFPNVLEVSDSHSINLFQPAISVIKTGDELSKIGDMTDFTITVCNNSSADTPTMYFDIVDAALGINLTDQVIAVGNCLVIDSSMAIPTGADDPYVNTVNVHATIDGFPNELDATASHSVNLFQPAIDITKTVNGQASIEADIGETVIYEITVSNNSSSDTPPLEFIVTDTKLVFSQTVTLESGNSYTWTVPKLITADMYNNDNPFINTVTTTASPIGFPNEYTASASCEVRILSEEETVWAKITTPRTRAFCFNGTGNWGWYNGVLTEGNTYTFDLWAGAAQCKTAKGTKVGTLTVIYSGDQLIYSVTPTAGEPALETAHVFWGTSQPTNLSYPHDFEIVPLEGIIDLDGYMGNVWFAYHSVFYIVE